MMSAAMILTASLCGFFYYVSVRYFAGFYFSARNLKRPISELIA